MALETAVLTNRRLAQRDWRETSLVDVSPATAMGERTPRRACPETAFGPLCVQEAAARQGEGGSGGRRWTALREGRIFCSEAKTQAQDQGSIVWGQRARSWWPRLAICQYHRAGSEG